jgi:predicted Fe-S protein YdhL (DUF1289 family)
MIPAPRADLPPAATPCISVCVMDAAGFCSGCGRTLEEIGAWPVLSDSGRRFIMKKLSARKATPASDSPL